MNKKQFKTRYRIRKLRNVITEVFVDYLVRYRVYKENKPRIEAMIQQFERQLEMRVASQDNSDLELTYYGVNEETFVYMRRWFKRKGWETCWSYYGQEPGLWEFSISLNNS